MYKSKRALFLVKLNLSLVSGHKMLIKLSACCHIQSQEKVIKHFIFFRDKKLHRVIVQKSLKENKNK